jgi:DNA-binding NtrC family response regulator
MTANHAAPSSLAVESDRLVHGHGKAALAPTPSRPVLIVDDEPGMRDFLAIMLGNEGYRCLTAPEGRAALAVLDQHPDVGLVLADLKMPGMSGLDLLREVRRTRPDLSVVVMTAYSTWESAVEAMRLGAYDYIKKPFDNDEVKAGVNRVMRALAARTEDRQDLLDEANLIGNCAAMQRVRAAVRRIGPTDATILIQGESGTGKELVARAIHRASLRADEAFVSVNCGSFTESLLDSELFGHVRGAFTGAHADKKGLFEVANGGSIFLDEIGELQPETQVRLLRVLEQREFLPVGGTQPRRVDVRFITATNRDLEAVVRAGEFREDLFYRLNVIPIPLPPLRDRREDVPLLAGHLLSRAARIVRKEVQGFSPEALNALVAYDWPGNVRELNNIVQRAVAMADAPLIRVRDLGDKFADGPAALTAAPGPASPLLLGQLPSAGFSIEKTLEDIERHYITAALERTGGHLTKAAELLGTSFRSLRYRVKKLGIAKEDF